MDESVGDLSVDSILEFRTEPNGVKAENCRTRHAMLSLDSHADSKP